MPTIDLTDEEHAAVTDAVRRLIEADRFPQAPRLDLLRSTLVKLEAAIPRPQPPKRHACEEKLRPANDVGEYARKWRPRRQREMRSLRAYGRRQR
jgi:hypothetical protein